MTTYIVSLLLSILMSFPCPAQTDEARNRLVDNFINAKIKALGIPGLAVAVIKDGRKVKLTTYGLANVEWNNKVTPHSAFQIASCTKLLTSTLIMKTIYKEKMSLEDPIGKFIDSIPSSWKQLKIKHLLNHSSGIKNYDGDTYASTATVVRALKDSTLEYTPGTSQHYAQFDFMLAGYILEKIYGKPFDQILKEEVTMPLQMKDGAFDMEQRVGSFTRTNLIPQKVTTYYELSGQLRAYKFIYPAYTYTAGGYFASIDDMANWAIGLDKETLFPKAFANKLIYGRDSIGNKVSEFTKAGWALEQENGVVYAGHSGGPGLGDVWRFPEEGYTFIVLSNDGELLPNFARAVASFYLKGLKLVDEIKKFER